MKIYDFTKKKTEYGRVVFALTLDKKRMTERIVIGMANEVKRRLEYDEGDVYYDETRPIGSLLINFENDKDGEWNKNHFILRQSYGKDKIVPEYNRWKIAAPAVDFLQKKYNSGEPTAIFAAIRTWDEYLYVHNKKNVSDTLTDRLHMMYKPFMVYGEYKPWDKRAVNALTAVLRDGEYQIELWYPVKKRLLETVVSASSFLPIIIYYTHKIEEQGFVYQQCKSCDKFFLAKSRRSKLCSDECRKSQAITAKKTHSESIEGIASEQLDKAVYQYWHNRWRRLKNGKAANPEKAAAFKTAFDRFRDEAVELKKAVKHGKMFDDEFEKWLFQQQNEADRLMDELAPKKRKP